MELRNYSSKRHFHGMHEILTTKVRADSIGVLNPMEEERMVEHALHLLEREIMGQSASYMSTRLHGMRDRLLPIVIVVEVMQTKMIPQDTSGAEALGFKIEKKDGILTATKKIKTISNKDKLKLLL